MLHFMDGPKPPFVIYNFAFLSGCLVFFFKSEVDQFVTNSICIQRVNGVRPGQPLFILGGTITLWARIFSEIALVF